MSAREADVRCGLEEADIERLARAYLELEGESIVRDMAGHVGDEVHAVLKRQGMLMTTTAGAIGVGILAAIEVLAGTVEFARRTADDDDERAMFDAGIAKLFADELASRLPAIAAAALRAKGTPDGR